MKTLARATITLSAGFLSVFDAARAADESPASFYTHTQIQMIIRASPGGSYDTFARLLARHIFRHIPGKPSIVSINMPGASGIKAANYVSNIAPHDGSVLSNISLGLPPKIPRDRDRPPRIRHGECPH
jgi:tripartite-type tricarboxylate transporter receptor subunit TctC